MTRQKGLWIRHLNSFAPTKKALLNATPRTVEKLALSQEIQLKIRRERL